MKYQKKKKKEKKTKLCREHTKEERNEYTIDVKNSEIYLVKFASGKKKNKQASSISFT